MRTLYSNLFHVTFFRNYFSRRNLLEEKRNQNKFIIIYYQLSKIFFIYDFIFILSRLKISKIKHSFDLFTYIILIIIELKLNNIKLGWLLLSLRVDFVGITLAIYIKIIIIFSIIFYEINSLYIRILICSNLNRFIFLMIEVFNLFIFINFILLSEIFVI